VSFALYSDFCKDSSPQKVDFSASSKCLRIQAPNSSFTGKSTFRNKLSFQRSESTTGCVQASVFINDIKDCFVSILTDPRSGQNGIITVRVLSLKKL
jgi:hypothetical protein